MLVKRSVALSGHRTSIALEAEFWTVLEGIAAREDKSLAALIAAIDHARNADTPLASALRVFALRDAVN